MFITSTIKLIIISCVIAFSSWLAGKKPELAGFIIAMPISSMIALAISYFNYKDSSTSITFAKSILIAVPVSWLFFIPFFLAERFGFGFWIAYIIGLLLLAVGYFIHKSLMGVL